jgi:uncharacterized Zn finger protein (UPF0148 family)
MHSATCPACGAHVGLDFKPVAGLVRCPKCDKLFSPSNDSERESGEQERNGASDAVDGEAD